MSIGLHRITVGESMLTLSKREAMMLVEALDLPVKNNSRLKQAAENYEDKKQS